MLIVMIVPVAPADLSADLTRRECCRVDIRISRIRGQRVFERVEVAGVNVLPCKGSDTSRRERACNGPGILRAGLRPWRGNDGRVRTEEHHDAAARVDLAEVDMRLRHCARQRCRGAHVRVGQREGGRL